METTKILMCENARGEPYYYDISSDELIRGAALQILQQRMEEGFFSQPRPLESNRIYRRNKQKMFNLEMILGDTTDEAFEEMQESLEYHRRMIKMHEQSTEKEQKEWDRIVKCIEEADGAEAVRILTERMNNRGEQIHLIDAPKIPAPEKVKDPAEV